MPKIFLPALHNVTPPAATAGPDYGALALTLALSIRLHPAQRRQVLVLDDELARVARLRCADMYARAYLAHTTPDGIGPNRFLVQNGVSLPDGYDGRRTANNVESLRLGPDDVGGCLAALLDSPGHRAHILGDGWWGGQRRIGVGVGPSWDHLQTIWCVLTLHG